MVISTLLGLLAGAIIIVMRKYIAIAYYTSDTEIQDLISKALIFFALFIALET